MDKRLIKKHYNQLDKEQLIELMMKFQEEMKILKDESEKFRIIKRQNRKIKRALNFIDFYTQGRKYITENDEELINILNTGRTGIWYETYKTQQKKNKRKN